MAQLSSTRFNILLTLYTIHFLLINRTSRTASYCLFFPVHWHPSTSSVKKPLQRSSRGGESANRETGCGGWLSTTCVDHTPGFSPARSSPARPNTIPPLLPATIHHNKTRIHLRLAHADVLNSVRPLFILFKLWLRLFRRRLGAWPTDLQGREGMVRDPQYSLIVLPIRCEQRRGVYCVCGLFVYCPLGVRVFMNCSSCSFINCCCFDLFLLAISSHLLLRYWCHSKRVFRDLTQNFEEKFGVVWVKMFGIFWERFGIVWV